MPVAAGGPAGSDEVGAGAHRLPEPQPGLPGCAAEQLPGLQPRSGKRCRGARSSRGTVSWCQAEGLLQQLTLQARAGRCRDPVELLAAASLAALAGHRLGCALLPDPCAAREVYPSCVLDEGMSAEKQAALAESRG